MCSWKPALDSTVRGGTVAMAKKAAKAAAKKKGGKKR
jgi:hypothetical protein